MEHILQFAINVDDEAIRNSVKESAEKQIRKNIELDILNEIFESRSYYSKAWKEDSRSQRGFELTKEAKIRDWATDLMVKALEDCRSEIIERVSKELTDRLMRTKAVKEAVSSCIEAEKKSEQN